MSDNISWQAQEFKEHDKPRSWFIIFGVVCLALIAYAVYQKSIITIITFGLLTALSAYFAVKKPKVLTHIITPNGIVVGDVVYPYKTIKTFWIVYAPPQVKTLNFETSAYINRFVTLELGSQDPLAVKMALKNYLIEDLDREESFSDSIARKLKF
ncbi:MAG: hypothetical protein HY336_00335 [Candidatus Doudnabacteria bacterium]|nr:hypothetical protein [Candidatus Doudnabacteria bacterium]